MTGGTGSVGEAWNGPLRRLVLGHLLAAAAEWAMYIGAFVYAFQRGGAVATGVASIVLLSVTVVVVPFSGVAVSRLQPNTARLISLSGQAVGSLIAGFGALSGGSLIIVLAGCSLTLSIFSMLRPSQAILIPLLCERPRQLTTTNLWLGHADSAAALLGPLVSTGLMLIGGPGALLVGFGIAMGLATALQLVDHGLGRSSRRAAVEAPSISDVVVAPFRQLRDRGGLLLIGLIMFQYGLVGALDILFVVIALDTLRLDEAASSLLTTFFGAGALGAVVLSTLAHRLNRLGLALSGGLFISGSIVAALAVILWTSAASITPLLIGLPLLGSARFLVVVISRALLQRSADDDTIGSVFALMEFGSGVGILSGSILAQVTLALSGPALTLAVIAGAYVVILLGSWRSVRKAEASATVPIVEMGLLRNVPAFAPLPPITLETVARHAELVEVAEQSVVIEQGEQGDRFFAVMTGSFDVVMDGKFVRTATRGDSFGEVALLANIDRTATVTSTEPGTLLAIEQGPFMQAITSHDSARQLMVGTVLEMDLGERVIEIPDPTPTEIGS